MAHVQEPEPEQQGFIVVLQELELKFGSKNVRIPVPKRVENFHQIGTGSFYFRTPDPTSGSGIRFRFPKHYKSPQDTKRNTEKITGTEQNT
jgi:hypothetical protein